MKLLIWKIISTFKVKIYEPRILFSMGENISLILFLKTYLKSKKIIEKQLEIIK